MQYARPVRQLFNLNFQPKLAAQLFSTEDTECAERFVITGIPSSSST